MKNPLEDARLSWTVKRFAMASLEIRIWPAGLVEITEPGGAHWPNIELLFENGECPDV